MDWNKATAEEKMNLRELYYAVISNLTNGSLRNECGMCKNVSDYLYRRGWKYLNVNHYMDAKNGVIDLEMEIDEQSKKIYEAYMKNKLSSVTITRDIPFPFEAPINGGKQRRLNKTKRGRNRSKTSRKHKKHTKKTKRKHSKY